jgi:hypothetical protein
MNKVAMCEVRFRGKTAKNPRKKGIVVNSKKNWIMINPI